MENNLVETMDRYLKLLVSNNPSNLPVSKDLQVTENGYPVQLGQGLFETASEITYRHYIPDPSASQVALFGVVKETMRLANFLVRLKIDQEKITEIETIIAREGTASTADPVTLKTPKPIFGQILDPSKRTPRNKMIAAVEVRNSYNPRFYPKPSKLTSSYTDLSLDTLSDP